MTRIELMTPPRPLPLLLRVQLLFGGFANQFGWILFGFGLIFLRGFGGYADIGAVRFWLGTVTTATGTVTSVAETSVADGGAPIYKASYTFQAEGREFQGISYGVDYNPPVGTLVTVEYIDGDPEASRILGCRGAIFPIWMLFVAIFPLVGAAFIFFGFRKGWKANHLLSHGRLAWATKKSSEPTNVRINNRMVMKLTFEFEAANGRTYKVVERTHQPEKLEDNEREAVLYDPLAPSYAVMLDSLPGSPTLTPEGGFRPAGTVRGGLVLIAPLVTVVVHGPVWSLFQMGQ